MRTLPRLLSILALPVVMASHALADECDSVHTAHNKKIDEINAQAGEWTRKSGSWDKPKDKAQACKAAQWYLSVVIPYMIAESRRLDSLCKGRERWSAGGGNDYKAEFWIGEQPRYRAAEQTLCGGGSPPAATQACSALQSAYEKENTRFIELNRKSASRIFDQTNEQKKRKAECEHQTWYMQHYLPFLQNDLKQVEDTCGDEWFRTFNKSTYRGSEYFRTTFAEKTKQAFRDACGASAEFPKPAVRTPTVSAVQPPAIQSPSAITKSPSTAQPSAPNVQTPAIASPSATTKSPSTAQPFAPNVQTPRLARPTASGSCSDITGTSSKAPAATHCATGRKGRAGST